MDVVDGIMENFIIAEIELKQNVLPFVLKRPLSHGGYEYWIISELLYTIVYVFLFLLLHCISYLE